MAIALRGDFDAPGLLAAARKSKDSGQARRLLRWRLSMTVRRAPRLPGSAG
jgi:hypothetical protein